MATIILCLLGVFGGTYVCAQNHPSGMSYQAVLRNASGGLIMDQNVGVRIRIRQGDSSGTIIYSEKHQVKTNGSGLLNLIIGKGEIVQGNFYTIDWAEGPYFLQTETDPNGGNDYVLSSTTQLLSVPFAYFAAKSGDAFSGDYNDLTNVPNDLVAEGDLAMVATTGSYWDLQDTPDLSKQVSKDELSAVALSGSYADLKDSPTEISVFSNDTGYLTNETLEFTYDPNFGLGIKGGQNFVAIPLPKKLSELKNDAGFIGFDFVKENLTMHITGPDGAGYYSMQLSDGENAIGDAFNVKVPVKVSELLNDSAYLTQVKISLELKKNLLTLTNSTDGSVCSIELPSRLSQFTDDMGFLQKSDMNLRLRDSDHLELRDRNDSLVSTVRLPESDGGGTKLPDGATRGDLLYWNNDGWKVLPAGLEGQVLTCTSAGLVWSNPTVFNEKDMFQAGDAFVNSRGETEGIIVMVDPVRRTGLLVALEDVKSNWSTEYDLVGADNWKDGAANLRAVSDQPDWQRSYPAFDAVTNYGNGMWYMPAFDEMKAIITQKESLNSKLLAAHGEALTDSFYLTSTERLTSEVFGVVAQKSIIDNGGGPVVGPESSIKILDQQGDAEFYYDLKIGDTLLVKKEYPMNFRPVRKLSWTELNGKVSEDESYKVGDVYYASDRQTPLGIVFEVSDNGRSGKIVSLTEKELAWTTQKRDASHGMDSKSGFENSTKLTSDPSYSKEKYPAMHYCMETMPWYMPSYAELKSLMYNFNVVQLALTKLQEKSAADLLKLERNYFSSNEDLSEPSEQKVSCIVVRQDKEGIESDYASVSKTSVQIVRPIREF